MLKPCAELPIVAENGGEGVPLNIEVDPPTEVEPEIMRFDCGRSHKMREARSMLPEAQVIAPALSVQFLREFRLLRDEFVAKGMAPMLFEIFLPVQRRLPFGRALRLLFKVFAPLPTLLPKLSCCASGVGFKTAPRPGF